MEQKLRDYVSKISGKDQSAASGAREYVDSLAKPPGSLGGLEDIAVAIAGITGKVKNRLGKRCVLVMSSDNGIVDEGVASAPQVVTQMMTGLFIKGTSGMAVLAKHAGAEIRVYDMGVNADLDIPGVIDKKIRKSTSNMAKGPAMSRDEALKAIFAGIEAAERAVDEGFELLGLGEMGIGNTSTSSAMLSAMTGCSMEDAVGRGAGLKEDAFRTKVSVLRRAIEVNKPNINDPLDVLSKLGGFDIAAMTGAYLGAAARRTPVVIDGFISIAAAYTAASICPAAKDFMLASHLSAEPGYEGFLKALGMKAPLNLGMRLGEGSGCPIMFMLIDAACAVARDMDTLAAALGGDASSEYLDNLEEA